LPIEVFGKHNLNNLAGAKWICQHMGIDEDDFYKVEATTNAVKEQYKNRTLVACLELHTYSSLNAEFLKEYKGALDAADVAVVFYSPHAVEIKKLKF